MAEDTDSNLLREISRFLRYHEALGIKEYPRSGQLQSFLNSTGVTSPSQEAAGKVRPIKEKKSQAAAKKHFFDPSLAKRATLRDVREELGECQRCPLHKTRTNIVFGQGPETAKLLIVTDSPGPDDDRRAIPLQGEAGELLDRMLAAIGMSRNEVYITSLVKCFPGNDVFPKDNEIKTCLPFLFRQVEIICPTIISALGTLAAQTLLHSGRSLFQLRGRFYNFNDLCSGSLENKIVLIPSLPPALLLQNAALKKASWKDLQLIQKKLEKN